MKKSFINIQDLRDNLSKYTKNLNKILIIRKRGKPIFEIHPFSPNKRRTKPFTLTELLKDYYIVPRE